MATRTGHWTAGVNRKKQCVRFNGGFSEPPGVNPVHLLAQLCQEIEIDDQTGASQSVKNAFEERQQESSSITPESVAAVLRLIRTWGNLVSLTCFYTSMYCGIIWMFQKRKIRKFSRICFFFFFWLPKIQQRKKILMDNFSGTCCHDLWLLFCFRLPCLVASAPAAICLS